MKVLVFGGGALGRQVLRMIAHHRPDLAVVGVIDDMRTPGTDVMEGVAVIGGLEQGATAFPPADHRLVFAIGYNDMRARLAAARRAEAAGYAFETIVHPRAVVEPDVRLGHGCIVGAGAVIDKGVRLGAWSYVDIGVRIGEDSTLGAGNYLSAGCTVAGNVRMGEANFLGLDVTVVTDMEIGNRTFVNAKTLVHRPVPDDMQVVEVHSVRLMARSGD